jgi:hypothetical protein
MLPSTSHFYIHPNNEPDPAITGMVGRWWKENLSTTSPPTTRHTRSDLNWV